MIDDDDDLDQQPDQEPAIPDSLNPQKIRTRKISGERMQEENDAFWHAALDSVIGRRVLWAFLRGDCHYNETRFMTGETGFPQPEATWFALGEQQIGQRLFDKLLVLNPGGVGKMLEEHDTRFQKKGTRR